MNDQLTESLTETGRYAYDAIVEMIDNIKTAREAGDCDAEESAEQVLREDPLDINVRSDFHHIGSETVPVEYEILLSTGGPATRIRGRLNEHFEPETAILQVQDWGTPWIDYVEECDSHNAGFPTPLLEYARHFYFGE